MAYQKFNDRALRGIAKPGNYFEDSKTATPGLALRVGKTGTKTWAIWYRSPETGKQVCKSLGRFPSVGIVDAKAKADRIYRLVQDDKDPAEVERLKAARGETYETAVADFIAKYAVGKKNNVTSKETERILLKYGEAWKKRAVTKISKSEIQGVLDDLMKEKKGYQANRCHAAFRTFFKWCKSRDKISENPTLEIERPFDGETRRTRIFSDDELKTLWTTADDLRAPDGALLKMLILSGKRKGALSSMRWDEIDDQGVWTPPQDDRQRTATKRTHATPLSRLAQRVLAGLPHHEDNPYVFASRKKKGAPVDAGSVFQRTVIEESGIKDFYPHGLRHGVETGLASLGVPPHIRDLLLDHAPPSRATGRRFYDHHLYLDEQRAAVELWADHIAKIIAGDQVKLLR